MTLFFLILITWSTTAATDTDNSTRAVNTQITNALRLLCPGANVCLANHMYGIKETSHTSIGNSCCTDCFCDQDCKKNNNCCFPGNIETAAGNSEPKLECLFPVIPEPKEKHRIFFQSYKMITDVLRGDGNDKTKMQATKCGDKKVAPWGSLFPVFSKKTNSIYKNEACAKEANITDGKLWDILLSCEYGFTTFWAKSVSSFITGLLSGTGTEGCEIGFKYPGDSSYLISETCFKDLINTCKATDFEIPAGMQMSKGEIQDACTSGLTSPYTYSNMYANVFCHLCNGERLTETNVCNERKIDRGPKIGSLSSLLDGVFLINKEQNLTTVKVPQACVSVNGNRDHSYGCRIVYCPSGQLRDQNGKCVFLIKNWYMTRCQVNIKLTTKKAFNINEIAKYSGDEFGEILLLFHKWARIWQIGSVYCRSEDADGDWVNSLYVTMQSNSLESNPKELITKVQSYLKLPWSLVLKNKTRISLSADWTHVFEVFKERPTTNTLLPKFVRLDNRRTTGIKPAFDLSKLYICDQIELYPSEFELFENNKILRNKIINKTLLTGEFVLAYSGVHESVETVKICFEDSGFIKSSDSSVAVVYNNFLLWLIILLRLFNLEI